MAIPVQNAPATITAPGSRPDALPAGGRGSADARTAPGSATSTDDQVTLSSAGQQLNSLEASATLPALPLGSTAEAQAWVAQLLQLIGASPADAMAAQATAPALRLGGLLGAGG